MIEMIPIIILVIWVLIEVVLKKIVLDVNRNFQWLITKIDEKPTLNKNGLEKFFKHGYDPELGWVRKPNTSHEETGKNGKTVWNINDSGARKNPYCKINNSKISCYGDSFTFGRQVNDDETWEYYLSQLVQSNVKNFGVGNYGIDQVLLRLKREFPKNRTDFVIMGVVPDTVSRIVSVWKHYYEYGNTFGFKPRFKILENKLLLVNNPIDEESKFYNYVDYLDEIRENDFFYKNKFKKEIISFPYSISILKNFKRNIQIIFRVYKNKNAHEIIMKRNLEWRVKLYENKNIVLLLEMIIDEYVNYSKKEKFQPIFIFLPQKDDILFIKNNFHFYSEIVKRLENKSNLVFIDIMEDFLNYKKLNDLFSENSQYGGHYSKVGNEFVAKLIYDKLNIKFNYKF